MVYYILGILSLVSLAAVAIILGRQIRTNRERQLDYGNLKDYQVTALLVDYLAFRIVRFCRLVLTKSYLFLVHFVKNSISTARYVIVKIERRFNHLASGLAKPEAIHVNDKVSSFLKEIKDYKETVMVEIKNDAENRELGK
ncbi:MAG: hypothetical protein COV08_01500 [Candidatus Vogelbacteria bacterium CG10_big_fil_rev_8_21_14_0_10_49_38]|uniref:Uncharacterized protein n=1 Tax=Candidatus Vogelbacteria bacterium CG10_big_fil_rev_8_21_14_0_10_49_38 TaxID=1975043 RepID=A0A2H0RJ83_9BACT|nr:MAG: hypothetical protein BK006_01515 [bacterium CG10_49_38]PIR46074.1 MAG: hypothetical protein COV08_01500 [Candidatus Vogelbacteria bacterium CG10_big_fil_rev_8_21_14_0_10_49_38]